MPRFQVGFVVRDWLTVKVEAENEKRAKEKAEEKMNNVYNKSDIECNDGKTDYVGITNLDVLDILDN